MRVCAAVLGLALLVAGGGEARALTQQQDTFPHLRHERLFPVCTGCHQGVPSGDTQTFYPAPATCNGCHDGATVRRVSWTPPGSELTNLRFTHPRHSQLVQAEGRAEQACESCHTPAGASRMAVSSEVQVGTCWSCHEGRDHRIDTECETCHVPLADTRFDAERIADLPVPADHEPARFPSGEHGRLARANLARCATCHTQERCVACHVDTGRAPIRAMPQAPPEMTLPTFAAHYNEPASHVDDGWIASHGSQASRSRCATCHTSDDCRSCHVSPAPGVVAQLPTRASAVAPGVHVARRGPESHESPFFLDAHATIAAAEGTSCATCHQERFCIQCHDAPSGASYHPQGFVAGHSAQAFGRDVECAACHNTQKFCRACHVEAGLTGFARQGPSFHDSQPLWLIRHGQSARQSLETCTSCHSQADCTRCHGTLGAFKVNPHSRDFDAEGAWRRNPRACLFCHVGNPLEGAGS